MTLKPNSRASEDPSLARFLRYLLAERNVSPHTLSGYASDLAQLVSSKWGEAAKPPFDWGQYGEGDARTFLTKGKIRLTRYADGDGCVSVGATPVGVGDVLAKNAETELSSKVTLLERDAEINDRFQGETHDHVLEAIKEARDVAEKEGRLRHAQLLESVLLANQPVGNLEKKRKALEKFFNDNGNILSGPVIQELEKCGISHKKGEEYLLPAEIIKRTY